MRRRPPRSTQSRSSAASDVYKRQLYNEGKGAYLEQMSCDFLNLDIDILKKTWDYIITVSYTHLRAHETVLDLVCRLLLEKKKQN